MNTIIQTFLWNFATWLTLGVFGGVVSGNIFNPEYLGMLSSAWSTMSSYPY